MKEKKAYYRCRFCERQFIEGNEAAFLADVKKCSELLASKMHFTPNNIVCPSCKVTNVVFYSYTDTVSICLKCGTHFTEPEYLTKLKTRAYSFSKNFDYIQEAREQIEAEKAKLDADR